MHNTMEGEHVREMHKACLKKKGRIDQEVLQVCEVIERIKYHVESTEAVTSPV